MSHEIMAIIAGLLSGFMLGFIVAACLLTWARNKEERDARRGREYRASVRATGYARLRDVLTRH